MAADFEISIIIPVYNRAAYLAKTFKSVLNQTYRPLQLILVDNGSTDSSWELCRAFQQEHQTSDFRIKVYQELKKGANSARNTGVRHCDTPYLYFFDSDDELSSDFIVTVLPLIKQRQLDVLGVKTMVVTPRGSAVRDSVFSCSPANQILMGLLPTQAAVYRTGFFKSVLWNEGLLTWGDWELGVRVLLACPAMEWYREKAFHRIYVHDESITGQSFSSRYEWIDKAMDSVFRYVRASSLEMRVRQSCLLALYYRRHITAGWLAREGSWELVSHCLQQAEVMLPSAKMHRIAGQMLYRYTRVGGRGAWRLAVGLLSV